MSEDIQNEQAGRAAYQADVMKWPNYNDGAPRKTWEQLGDVERWSWCRNPTPPKRVGSAS